MDPAPSTRCHATAVLQDAAADPQGVDMNSSYIFVDDRTTKKSARPKIQLLSKMNALKQTDLAVHKTQKSCVRKLWMLLCFKSRVFGTIAIHADVSGIRSDAELFALFRELYFRESGWIRRCFDMKEVKKITVINVRHSSNLLTSMAINKLQ